MNTGYPVDRLFNHTPTGGIGGGDRTIRSVPYSDAMSTQIQSQLKELQRLSLPPVNALGSDIRIPFQYSVLNNGVVGNIAIAPAIPGTRIYIQHLEISLVPQNANNGAIQGVTIYYAIPNDTEFPNSSIRIKTFGGGFKVPRWVWQDAIPPGSPYDGATKPGALYTNRIGFTREYAPLVLDEGLGYYIFAQTTNGLAPAQEIFINTDGYYMYTRRP